LTGSCEKRGLLATEAKRKSARVLASAAAVWQARGERVAKIYVRDEVVRSARSLSCIVAAITSGGGRNRGEHRP
jgi:hypothetical protein